MARGLIPGRSGSTLSGEPTVPGKIPGGIASLFTPVRQLSGVASSTLLLVPSSTCLYGGSGSYSHYWPHGGERLDGR